MVFSIRISSWKSKSKTLISILSNQYEFISTLPLRILSKIIISVYFNLFLFFSNSKCRDVPYLSFKFKFETQDLHFTFFKNILINISGTFTSLIPKSRVNINLKKSKNKQNVRWLWIFKSTFELNTTLAFSFSEIIRAFY